MWDLNFANESVINYIVFTIFIINNSLAGLENSYVFLYAYVARNCGNPAIDIYMTCLYAP